MIHHTLVADAAVLCWTILDDEWEVCAPALIDRAHQFAPPLGNHYLARLNYDEAEAVAKREGGQLISSEQIETLRKVGVQLKPFLGTPRAENGIEHSALHDDSVWSQLHAIGWTPDGAARPVTGAGKHWVRGAPPGKSRLKGWDRDGAGPGQAYWQPDAVAHNRQHFDDGTTTLIVRRRVAAPPDTEPTPPTRRTSIPPAPISTTPKAMHYTDPIKFVQARNYRKGRVVPIRLLVIHDMEAGESNKTAENVASWFAGSGAPMASAHYNVDGDSIVQSVKEEDTAFAAPPCNPDGIHFELAGYAKQTPSEWADAFSAAMLERAACLMADVCARHSIPPVFIDEAGLLAGKRGITTHACISRAYKKSTHLDPGKSFPLEAFIASIAAKMGECPQQVTAPHVALPPNLDGPLGQTAALMSLGYSMSSGLASAVRAFQAANPPLVADGILGPKSKAVLFAALSERG